MFNRNARLAGCALVVGLLFVPEALPGQVAPSGRPVGVNTPREMKARRLLQKRLRRAMASRIARQGKLSLYVKVLRGPTVFARGGNLRVHPASCVKIVTSAVALRKLGVNFKFETVLSGRRQGPALVTPLYVRGQGDPTLTHEDLGRFARTLYKRGIRQIPKGIVVDVTFFDRRRFPPGFGRRSSEGYIAPTGAVSINGNVVKVRVSPQKGKSGCTPKVTVEPSSDYVTLQHTVKCSKTKTRLRASAVRDGNRLKVVVAGNLNENASEKKYDRRVLYPWRFAGETLKTALVGRGIKVGPVRRGRMASADVLIRHRSEPFSKIVTHMNRQSDNFYAEQVLKVIGAKVFKPPGSTAKGLRALRGLLTRSRVRPGTYVISNGSGLFGQTRMSASQLVRLLSRVTTLDWLYKALFNSLPVAGHAGTLGSRLSGTAASGRVYAKTGTMRSVSTLAGYVRSRSKTGAVVVFAILHNGFSGGVSNSRRLQDEMVLAMARYLDQW